MSRTRLLPEDEQLNQDALKLPAVDVIRAVKCMYCGVSINEMCKARTSGIIRKLHLSRRRSALLAKRKESELTSPQEDIINTVAEMSCPPMGSVVINSIGEVLIKTEDYLSAYWMNTAGNPVELLENGPWKVLHRAPQTPPEPTQITITRPTVAYGPKGVHRWISDCKYLRDVEKKIREGHVKGIGGSNVTEMIRQLISDAALALETEMREDVNE